MDMDTIDIPEVKHMNYRQRLVHLQMYSRERRMERYRILYAWKVLERLVPSCGLDEVYSEKIGREIRIPQVKGSGKCQTIR